MGNYGFRISKDDQDVKTCADKDCVVTSKYPILKGSFSVGGIITPRIGNKLIGSVNTSTNYITCNAHGLQNNDRIYFTTYGTLPAPLIGAAPSDPEGTTYFIINKTTNTFQVSLTPNGSAVDITSAGSGSSYINPYSLVMMNHNLGYVPILNAFVNPVDSVEFVDEYQQLPFFIDGMEDHLYTYAYADTVSIYLRLEQWNTSVAPYGGARNYNYKIFIFVDRLTV